MQFATRAIRVGQEPTAPHYAVIPPLYQTSTFAWPTFELPVYDYTRVNNPTRDALEQVVASLEGGSRATVFASGMAAIHAVFSLLKQGDTLMMASDIYGGTHRLAHTVLPGGGVATVEFDACEPGALEAAAVAGAKMVIFETPTNPTLKIVDIRALAASARKLGLISVLDNTFASPALQNPLELGVDLVVHSTTKYIGGHSDVIGGAVVSRDPELGTAMHEWAKNCGAVPSPFDCWLTLRGVKTLDVRMQRHCSNSQAVAEFCAVHPRVTRVHYPGLPSHPGHAVAKGQMRGFGGMVSIEVEGTADHARKVAQATQVFLMAESLGGVESLIGYPPLMSHGGMTEEQRLEIGIPPTLLRLSVGIEDPADLLADLDQALAAGYA